MKKLVSSILAVLVLAACVIVDATADTYESLYPYEYGYKVKTGDTLWSIANDTTDGDITIDRVVYEIRQQNGIDNNPLLPGTVLVLRSKTQR